MNTRHWSTNCKTSNNYTVLNSIYANHPKLQILIKSIKIIKIGITIKAKTHRHDHQHCLYSPHHTKDSWIGAFLILSSAKCQISQSHQKAVVLILSHLAVDMMISCRPMDRIRMEQSHQKQNKLQLPSRH